MATYTYTQLYGSGSIGENLVRFKNSLPLQTQVDPLILPWKLIVTSTKDSMNQLPQQISKESYVVSQSMGQVTSSYISSVVVQPGVSSFTFTPIITQ
jgi:hypothetical protein